MFAKMYASLWRGSLHGTGVTWAVFVYLLAHADPKGIVNVLPKAIAGDTGFTLDQVLAALAELEGPDTESKTPDQEGRRPERIDEHRSWGWLIVNYEKYRNMQDADTIRSQTLARVRRHREKRNRGFGDAMRTEPDPEPVFEEFVPLEGPVGPRGKPPATGPIAGSGRPKAPRHEETQEFEAVWKAWPAPRRVSRRTALRAYVSALGRHKDVTPEDLLAATEAYCKRIEYERREMQFVPHLTTWLNQDRFMEEFEDENAGGQP